jgi:hypothetical protein
MIENKSISKLDLRNKQLTRIPPVVFKLRNLKKLDLRNNNLKSIPVEISKLSRLEVLDVSYNDIQYLYAGFFKLKNLKILIISNNKLKSIPRQIGNLSKLQILIVSRNNLVTLPEELEKLTQLQELNIAKNKFESFPQVILKLQSLKALWLNSNNFNSFPSKDILKNLSNLKSLYTFGFPTVEISDKNFEYLKLSKIRGNTLKILINLSKIKLKPKMLPKSLKQSKPPLTKINAQKTRIFISYSHWDSEWLERVQIHLKALNQENSKLEVWDDTKILAGKKWKEEIADALDKCKIAILLISTYFLASDFIANDELPVLLKNAEEKGTKILPLIILPSRFLKNKNLSGFQAVNDPEKPLSKLTLSEQEEILVKLTNDVETYLE